MSENQSANPSADEDVVVIDQNDTEALKTGFTTALGQKKHWRSKAIDSETGKTWKERFDELKAKAETPKTGDSNPTPPINGAASKPVDSFDSVADNLEVIRELRADELGELRTVSRELGVDPVKYIKSKAGQAHLKDIRATRKVDDTTPGSSSRIPVFNGKPVKDIFKDDKASSSDKQAAFEAMMKKGGLNQNQ